MKLNLKNDKRFAFLIAALSIFPVLGNVEQATNGDYEVEEIKITTEVIVENPVTHEQEMVVEEVVTIDHDKVTVEEKIEYFTPASSVQHLATMINDGTITNFDQLIHASKNFPELVEVAHRFLKEKITDNITAFRKFSTIKDPKIKKAIITLINNVNKDKLWAIFR